jgi:hypothetical protein
MIRLALETDVGEILPRLREQERVTIERLGIDPAALLEKHIGPYAYTGLVDGEVACMWGIGFPGIAQLPRLWLLTTPLVERHRIRFLRESRRFVLWARAEFGIIEGCVDCQNHVSRMWLQWLGFKPVDTDGQYMRLQHGD